MKLGPVIVMTPDLEAAAEFYRDALGLRLAHRTPDQLIFELGGAALHIFRCEHAAGAEGHGRDAASVITFEVQSLSIEMERLRTHGVTFIHEKPARNEAARLNYMAFVAPGGNVHELVERT
ncbi:VOC family protein [Phenylobacterium sp.]|uniref:VOC family protein n=1 Tax=Phenylobacterium sp. TaxID=1871053 RepID=UPI002FDA8C8F